VNRRGGKPRTIVSLSRRIAPTPAEALPADLLREEGPDLVDADASVHLMPRLCMISPHRSSDYAMPAE